ncbi:hypothetical protein P7K49_014516, partial [Saguinus oedipus]
MSSTHVVADPSRVPNTHWASGSPPRTGLWKGTGERWWRWIVRGLYPPPSASVLACLSPDPSRVPST